MSVPADPFADHPLPSQPIIHCPVCGSGLIHPIDSTHDGYADRIRWRCPECEYGGAIVTSPLVAALWRTRDICAAEAMSRLADALARDRTP